MELLPTRYLSVAGEYAGAVHIPLAELERRTHELPPPVREVWVVADSWDAYHALGWLQARGRRARLVSAPPPDADPTARYRLWEPNEWLVEVVAASDLTPYVPLSRRGRGGTAGRTAVRPYTPHPRRERGAGGDGKQARAMSPY
jgi:hypothetical protein